MTALQPRAGELHVIACHDCGLVMRDPGLSGMRCARCREPLERRKKDSLRRCWAFLIAAVILYLPANLLPMMQTSKLGRAQPDTILSGVIYLWNHGSQGVAIVVFVASILVPITKVVSLVILLVTTQRRSLWRQRERTWLVRALELIGYWSMLDVFVVAVLVTLVSFGGFARVDAGPGIIAFAAVVVLTMLAQMSFDPRLIWDTER